MENVDKMESSLFVEFLALFQIILRLKLDKNEPYVEDYMHE